MIKATKKFHRLRRLAKHGASRIYVSGVLPCALYGAEHISVPQRHISTLQHQAVLASSVKPFGVPTAIAIMAQPTTNDPGFIARSAPILRWAREMWMITGNSQDRHGDCLGGYEAHGICNILNDEAKSSNLPQGPVRAIADSLKWFNWTMPKAILLLDDLLQELDMSLGTPAMLKSFLVASFQRKTMKINKATIAGRPNNLPAETNWAAILKIIRSRKVAPSIKQVVLEVIYGTLPTPHWLWNHGWQISNTCKGCGEIDDFQHALTGCHGSKEEQQLLQKWKTGMVHIPLPPLLRTKEGFFCSVNGFPCALQDFCFDYSRPIYTDGSAKDIGWAGIAVASAAAYQTGSDNFVRLMVAQIPQDFPISAVSSEFFAFSMVLRAIRPTPNQDKYEVVTDCSAVVTAFNRPSQHRDYRSKYGGLWKESTLGLIGKVTKMRAHLDLEEAKALNLEEHWSGNDRADFWAKDTIDSTGKNGAIYKKLMGEAIFNICLVAKQLVTYSKVDLAQLKKSRGVPNEKRGGEKKLERRHSFRWDETRWVCCKCGCSKKRRQSKVDLTNCRAFMGVSANAHCTHCLSQGVFGKAELPILFCRRCGGYSTTRNHSLKRPCLEGTNKATRHKKSLLLGVHPLSKEPIWGISRVVLGHPGRPPGVSSDLSTGLRSTGLDIDLAGGCALGSMQGPEALAAEALAAALEADEEAALEMGLW